MSAVLNPEMLYLIDPFKGSEKDRKLVNLSHFLKYIWPMEEMQPIELLRKQFEEKEIKISNNIEEKVGKIP